MHNQGNLDFTDNTMDIAISGRGMFVTRPGISSTDGTPSYTRAGAFQVNSEGYVTNSSGEYLQTFPVNESDGSVQSTSLSSTIALKVPSTAGTPTSTKEIELGANLPSTATPIDSVANPFFPGNSNSFNTSTSINIYDSQGGVHTMTYYFVKDGTSYDAGGNPVANGTVGSTIPQNQWQVYPVLNTTDANGNNISLPMQMVNQDDSVNGSRFMRLIFDNNGEIDQEATANANSSNTADTTILNPTPKFHIIPDDPANIATYVSYDNNLQTEQTVAAPIPANGANLGEGATQNIGLDMYNNSPTQFAANFNVTTLAQDGYTAGRLSGLDISDEGIIRANYSNGQQSSLGKIALALFPNEQGLKQLGDTAWAESIDSGPPLVGEAGTGSFGSFRAGALEGSNVDLTQQLVKLITAQRSFQANAKAIETNSAITQTIINLR